MRTFCKKALVVAVCIMMLYASVPCRKARTYAKATPSPNVSTTADPSAGPAPSPPALPERLDVYWDKDLGAVITWAPFVTAFACTLERKDSAAADFNQITTVDTASGRYIDFTIQHNSALPLYRLCLRFGDNVVISGEAAASVPVAFGNSGGNLLCGGIACYESGVSYRVASYRGIIGIYAQPESGEPKLLAPGIAMALNIADGYLYYLNYPEGQPCHVPLNGSEAPVILNETRMTSLLAAGDRIYGTLASDATLVVMDRDGGNLKTFVSGACYDLGGYGNTLYYTNVRDAAFCMMDLSDSSLTTIPLSNPCFAQLWQDKVYYLSKSDGNTLYRCNPDGKGKEKLLNMAAASANITEHGIYVIHEGDNIPYRANLDGSGLQKLANVKADYLCVCGTDVVMANSMGKIYCLDEDGVLK